MSHRVDGPLITWYGDDFTGASAVLEVLSFAGVSAVLFLQAPDEQQLAEFADYRAIGIAGSARSQSPEWMEVSLPTCFSSLAKIAAPIAHYKVCSTFDSAPGTGSIGKAIELAIPILGGAWHPLVVGAPQIGRYQVFGNLFAAVAGTRYRLDRHPVMSRHPVTPMGEADLLRHLGRQTTIPSALVDIASLGSGRGEFALSEARAYGADIISLDILDEASLIEVGRLMWENRGERLFAVGSQGVEYALIAYWRAAGLLPADSQPDAAGSVDRLAIVSGSCSPITAGQIKRAATCGFQLIRIDASQAVSPDTWQKEQASAANKALAALGAGASPLIYTASGPDDPAIASFKTAVQASGKPAADINARVAQGLGAVLAHVTGKAKLKRGVIAGGDTSSHATASLGLNALTALAPIAPGAPLCRGHSANLEFDGFEIALKGGQMGPPDYFNHVRQGS
ncbi:MAG: four-carbon acid sugar kinase family protein [Pseudomonadota bacterium]